MKKDFFAAIYDIESNVEKDRLYSEWASTYDADLASAGYATPRRCAEAVFEHAGDSSLPVLDVGCGTGISGLALRDAGFSTIDGTDINGQMLEKAKKLNLYRNVWKSEPEDPVPVETGSYGVIATIGVIGAGAAPLDLLHICLAKLAEGGLMTFSFNDHTIADPAYDSAVGDLVESGRFILLHKTYGPHLKGLKMNSNVYVLGRT